MENTKKNQDTPTDMKDLLIDFERISIGDNIYENIKCILCFRIPFYPLIVDCCENIICNQCHKSWSIKSKSCPLCRQDEFKVGIPNRFIRNIYSSIKYFCSFKEKGCLENNLVFDSIAQHEEKCEFNPNRVIVCEKCEAKYCFNEAHDCILGLIEKNKNLKNKILSLEKEIELFKNESQASHHQNEPREYNYLFQTLKIHQHILVKVSRKNGWRCNCCRSSYSRNQVSCYCYDCDFDCCENCLILCNKPQTNQGHPHELITKNFPPSNFVCDHCKNRYDSHSMRYRCVPCDFDLCHKCRY